METKVKLKKKKNLILYFTFVEAFRNSLREPTTTLHQGAQYPSREKTTTTVFHFRNGKVKSE